MMLFPDQFPCVRPSAVILLLVCVLFSANILAEEPQLQFTRISEFKNIVDIANAGDGSGRLFLVSQRGTIFILKDGKKLETPFLSIHPQGWKGARNAVPEYLQHCFGWRRTGFVEPGICSRFQDFRLLLCLVHREWRRHDFVAVQSE